ncbi:MAG: MFS transporter [Candidatus Nanopelagicaceae bacterium]
MKRWLSRNLIVLTIVSMAQDAASELIYPLMPLLIAGVVGAAPLALGIIEGFAEFVAGVSKLYAGKFSDRFGRKRFVVGGYSAAVLGKVFVVFSLSWQGIFAGRVIDRIGKGFRGAPRDALIHDGVEDRHLGKAFGFHRAGDNLGAVIGPLLALFLLALTNDDVRTVAKWALIPALLSAALTFFVKEVRAVKPAQRFEKVPLTPKLKKTIALLVAIQLTNIPDALLLLRLHDMGFSTKGVVLGYALYMFVATLAAYPAGKVADRLHPKQVYLVGLTFFAIAYITLGLTNSHAVALIALALYGFFPALTDGVGKAWIGRLSSPEARGYSQGLFQATMSFAILAAGIWGGLLWSSGTTEIALVIAGIGALVGALLISQYRSDAI